MLGLDLRRKCHAVFRRQGSGFKRRLLFALHFLRLFKQGFQLPLNIGRAARAGYVREALGLTISGSTPLMR